jgi:hypothetical protein
MAVVGEFSNRSKHRHHAATHEFSRRFVMHVLPKGFHRIRHYGLLANGNRAAAIARARELLAVAPRGGHRRLLRPPRRPRRNRCSSAVRAAAVG